MSRSLSLLCLLLALASSVPGCGRQDSRTEIVRTLEEQTLEDGAGEATSLQAEEGERGPEEIYYDLTQFDWYRRGEPLIAEERSYRPAGKPEATMGRRFEKAGEYEGVSYYEQEGAESPPDTVYVPVFPDYWLPFAASATPE